MKNRTKAQNTTRDIKVHTREKAASELTDEELANVTGGDSGYLNPDGTEVEVDLEADVSARSQVKSSPSRIAFSPKKRK